MRNRSIRRLLMAAFSGRANHSVQIQWVLRDPGSWLCRQFQSTSIETHSAPCEHKIEELARKTNQRGSHALWTGYGTHNVGGPTRRPDDVRTTSAMGRIYANLVMMRKPDVVVEFGTAFGVSGMYFLAGIEANQQGQLLTFEPNLEWAEIARANLVQIGKRFQLTVGTFEENIERFFSSGRQINLAFIDAIHTPEFVLPQLELVLANSARGSIILLDDINFSPEMSQCWSEISRQPRFSASAKLGDRVGILERGV
jgi:predicted O-methyltransferase YrrM